MYTCVRLSLFLLEKVHFFLMYFIFLLSILLLALGLFEAISHARHVKTIPIRILVNGTRGKTTVTRQLHNALASKMSVLAKTTGSQALLIYPDSSEHPVSRRFGYHLIREQYKFFALASSLKVDAVIVECSAVSRESQLIMAQKLVRPTCSIITNARIDHVDQMGNTVESTAEVLKLSVPKGQKFYTSDFFFASDSQAIVVEGGNEELVGRVLEKEFGIKEFSLDAFKPDLGLVGPFSIGRMVIVNAFAANDKQSASEVLDKYVGQDYIVLYNNRADREFRVPYFASLFETYKVKQIVVLGEHVNKCVRFFSKQVPYAKIEGFSGTNDSLISMLNTKNSNFVIGMGNIKGAGTALIEYCIAQTSKEDLNA